jgi:YD repeat-containing protein
VQRSLQYTYDGLGNRTRTVSPDTGTVTWTYDADSLIQTITETGSASKDFDYSTRAKPRAAHPDPV